MTAQARLKSKIGDAIDVGAKINREYVIGINLLFYRHVRGEQITLSNTVLLHDEFHDEEGERKPLHA